MLVTDSYSMLVRPDHYTYRSPLSASLHPAPRQMNVSTNEQKLSWEFMRAIESSARKGRVVLVIDGVDRLESRVFSRMKVCGARIALPPHVLRPKYPYPLGYPCHALLEYHRTRRAVTCTHLA